MSQENVDLGRAAMDAYARGDLPGMLRYCDPEIRFEPQVSVLQGGYVGHDGVKEFMADDAVAAETFKVLQADYSEVRDLGDQTLSFGSFRLAGGESGIDAEVPFAIVTRYRAGLITHLKDYGGDKEEALKAVGLTK